MHQRISTAGHNSMERHLMSEPASSAAAGVAGWKLIGGAAGAAGIGAAMAAIVVMCMTLPRSLREWAVALISTVICSLGGGALVILKFNLLGAVAQAGSDIDLLVTLMGVLGIVFACGLPGWAVVRWVFNWLDKRKDRDLGEIVGEVRGVIGGSK